MDLTTVFAWFAQESISIADQANEPERRETFTHLVLLWATAAQQCSGGAPAMQSSHAADVSSCTCARARNPMPTVHSPT